MPTEIIVRAHYYGADAEPELVYGEWEIDSGQGFLAQSFDTIPPRGCDALFLATCVVSVMFLMAYAWIRHGNFSQLAPFSPPYASEPGGTTYLERAKRVLVPLTTICQGCLDLPYLTSCLRSLNISSDSEILSWETLLRRTIPQLAALKRGVEQGNCGSVEDQILGIKSFFDAQRRQRLEELALSYYGRNTGCVHQFSFRTQEMIRLGEDAWFDIIDGRPPTHPSYPISMEKAKRWKDQKDNCQPIIPRAVEIAKEGASKVWEHIDLEDRVAQGLEIVRAATIRKEDCAGHNDAIMGSVVSLVDALFGHVEDSSAVTEFWRRL